GSAVRDSGGAHGRHPQGRLVPAGLARAGLWPALMPGGGGTCAASRPPPPAMTKGPGRPVRRLARLGPLPQFTGTMMKRLMLTTALLAAGLVGAQGVAAQEKIDLDMTARIRQEAFQRSQVM